MNEIWKDIKGFEGYYQISNRGRLKSFNQLKEGRILSNKNQFGWYLTVNLVSANERVTTRIHRLVAQHFIPNPEGKRYVNHLNGDKQDNRVENLEWCTCRENIMHAIKMNPSQINGMIYRNQVTNPKTIIQKSLDGHVLNEFENSKIASDISGVCSRNILQVASKDEYKPGKTRKQAGGFIWEYKQEPI